jgi:hypothetical protein
MRAIIVQALWFRRDRSDDTTRISYEALGEMVGCSADTAKRQVKWLVDNGFMTKGRASSHDATSVFAISEAALTSNDAPTPRANPSAGEGGFASSTRRIRTVDQGNVPSSVDEPISGVQNRTVEEGNLPSSDQGNLPSSTTSKNKKNNPPTPQPSILSDDLGFSEFWGRYPPCEWKQRTSKTNLRGFWFNLTDKQRHLALRALDAYIASAMWIDKPEDIPGPKIFLENEPWLEAERGNLPAPPPPPVKYLTAADVRLTDEDD